MHPDISAFPSRYVYGGRLGDDESVLARLPSIIGHPCEPRKPASLLMWDSDLPNGNTPSADEVQYVRTAESGTCSRKHVSEAARAADLALAIAAVAGPGSVAVLTWHSELLSNRSAIVDDRSFAATAAAAAAAALDRCEGSRCGGFEL